MKASGFFVALISVQIWINLVAAAKTKVVEESETVIAGEKRFKEILMKEKESNILTLVDKNFTKYIADRPRVYNVIVMFTALHERYKCAICTQALTLYKEAALYYRSQYTLNSTSPENRLVFTLIDVDSGRSTFGKVGIETIPRTFVLPTRDIGSSKQKLSEFEIDSSKVMEEGIQGLLDEIKLLSKIEIKVTIEPWPVLFVLGIVAVLLALLVTIASMDYSAALLWYRSPKLWIVFSLICFGVGISGSIYCIIRSVPLYEAGRDGNNIMSGRNREQYLLEGIIIALLTIASSFSFILMYAATKAPYSIVRHTGVIFFCCCDYCPLYGVMECIYDEDILV